LAQALMPRIHVSIYLLTLALQVVVVVVMHMHMSCGKLPQHLMIPLAPVVTAELSYPRLIETELSHSFELVVQIGRNTASKQLQISTQLHWSWSTLYSSRHELELYSSRCYTLSRSTSALP
jgi:hypothetical protein